MSLFIGNLSRRVTASELEKVFGEFGRCKINFFGKYAFAEFDSEKDAEEACKNLMSTNIEGSNINIEWSKKSRKFDPSKSRPKRSSISPRKKEGRCYICKSKGHYQKDCRERDSRRKYRSRSRSRSRSRDRRRSRSRERHRRRSRSRGSRSRSHSYRKKRSDSRHRRRSSTSSNYRPRTRSSSSRRDNRNDRTSSKYDRNDRRIIDKKDRNEKERSGSRNFDKKENGNNKNQNNNKLIEKDEVRNSRNSSRGTDRSNRSPKTNGFDSDKHENKHSNYNPLEQILDEDFITSRNQNDYKDNSNNDNNAILNPNENSKNNDISKKDENTENMDESYYNKLKVDELKNELKKRNINFPKNARKNELIELLTKK